jgi:hypothetical protein
VRVDMHLEDGVSASEVDRWVQTASILLSNGNAMDIGELRTARTGCAQTTGTVSGPVSIDRSTTT